MPNRRAWGAGQIIPPASPGGGWSIRWSEGSRRLREHGFPTRDLAQRALDAKRGDRARERIGIAPDVRSLPALAVLADSWLARREHTHRSWRTDRNRWRRDLKPFFGALKAPEVTVARIRAWVEERLRAGLAPGTVGLGVRLLSTFWSDLAERPRETGATTDPTKRLPRSLRDLIRPTHDPRLTPYLRSLDHVRRVYLELPKRIARGFAVGALAGLRTGEVLALDWERDVDLERRQLVVQRQVQHAELGPLKDDEARILQISDSLYPVLAKGKLAAGGRGLVLPPTRPGRRSGPARKPATFMRPQTLASALRVALRACGLDEKLTWYQCTRHTFASHYVRAGGSLTKLAALLGHSSAEVTQRYTHLQPADVDRADISRVAVKLRPETGQHSRHSALRDQRKHKVGR